MAKTTFTKTCAHCGAEYELVGKSQIMRDDDYLSCECGEELHRWNGAVIYSKKLIRHGSTAANRTRS